MGFFTVSFVFFCEGFRKGFTGFRGLGLRFQCFGSYTARTKVWRCPKGV